MEEIELRDLYYMIVKRIWLIVLITVLSVVASGLVSMFLLTPEYETFTTLMLGKPADYNSEESYTYQDVLTNQKLIGTYGEIAKSRVVLNEVKSELNLDLKTSELSEMISVTLLKNTEIIKVTVRDVSPERAADIANSVAKTFMKNVSDIMQINNVQVIDSAEVPVNPVSPRVKMNIAIAGVLGVMVSVFIIFIMEAFDNTIKIPEDVDRYLELPVIGMIPEHD
ncbi:capsular biosynthesis protein [Acidaminobacter sp. JC074]|uniref:YveK family protein n=1 Tax=Acidaminobacter sp. JC074 TaxID=2530199 RepID=UPI001F111616|nr:Wzz/FepE/Etk N-terminal domain-containing protein [Acidaminobacter sp. JC074]MCH4890312.1 capsular biosynthesis protein [Acidaminobacter sp. JC074]